MSTDDLDTRKWRNQSECGLDVASCTLFEGGTEAGLAGRGAGFAIVCQCVEVSARGTAGDTYALIQKPIRVAASADVCSVDEDTDLALAFTS